MRGFKLEKIELSTVSFNEARLVPQALFCRWFQPTVLNTGGKASSSVGFIPFHNIISGKGLKPTEESGKTGKIIYPSVETQCHQFKKKIPLKRKKPLEISKKELL